MFQLYSLVGHVRESLESVLEVIVVAMLELLDCSYPPSCMESLTAAPVLIPKLGDKIGKNKKPSGEDSV